MKLHLQRSQQGVALVIVLTFVVLVTGLIVAYFSRSMTERQTSNSSFNTSKVDILARSATDIIVSDFKQEITKGSNATTIVTTVGGNTVSNTVYLPTSNATAVPTRTAPDTIPNLIRRSGDVPDAASPAVSSRASAVNSTVVSANGRFISTSRWNSHYLIPRFDKGDAVDATPDATAGFTAPNWVMVTKEKGPVALASPTTDANNTPVTPIGRYAYAVYDEGGLLDLNAAGYPTGLSAVQAAGKDSMALADLTQLPTVKSPSTNSNYLTQAQVDNIVGWRNYASAQLTASNGTFNACSFTTANAANWLAGFAKNNQTGFLGIYSGVSGTPARTDQALLSRQQLLRLRSSMGFSQNVLQYLGTFSRDVNTPSFYYPASPAATNDPVSNVVNPNILTANLRMTSRGTASDGFTWEVGDPLVGRRFSLSRLAWITFEGPSATASTATRNILLNAGVPQTVIDQGTAANIQTYFGLYRNGNSGPWIYTSGDGGTTPAPFIKTLDKITGREPDFFELLNAAIHKDSIGVMANRDDLGATGLEDTIDKQSDLQILRIGANIIDQADPDSYPTVIGYQPAPTDLIPILYAYGIEDLPYVSALGIRSVPMSYDTDGMYDQGPSMRELQEQFVPVLWNPHRPASPVSAQTGVPAEIEMYMVGRTRYYMNDNAPNNVPDQSVYRGLNDANAYGSNSRYNEIALDDNSTFTVTPSSRNTGSVKIASSNFASFASPSLISGSSGITASGQYQQLKTHPYYSTSPPFYGLALINGAYAKGRAPYDDIEAKGWDGYFTDRDYSHDLQHHFLNLGSGQHGFNVVLRYKDYTGQFRVYNSFAGNVADPDGKIYTQYDTFGICKKNTGESNNYVNTIYMNMLGTGRFPRQVNDKGAAVTKTDTTWQQPGGSAPGGLFGGAAIRNPKALNDYFIIKADPRTSRLGFAPSYHGGDEQGGAGDAVASDITTPIRKTNYEGGRGIPFYQDVSSQNGTQLVTTTTGGPSGGHYYPAMWSQNRVGPDGTFYYDWNAAHNGRGIVRPGDDYLTATSGLANTSGTTATNNIYQDQSPTNPAKPVVLNRPFRNVGELGYVFRDLPFKSLDLFSKASVDAALLDFFTVDTAASKFAAGKVNINTRQKPVLQSILSGVLRQEDPTSPVSIASTAAGTLADDIIAFTKPNPLRNKAELVTKVALSTSNAFNGGSTFTYPSIKTQREAPIRALAGVANTRTWNLLIDVVAQTGRYPSSATAVADLPKFIVEGERRYWLHVAIDRYTGRIVDQQLEPVYE